jgi:molybdate transport system substrate-binding protein
MKRPPCRNIFRVGSLGLVLTGFFLTSVRGQSPAGSLPSANRSAASQSSALSVAAASNLVYVLDELNAAFRSREPNVVVATAVAASGSLVAQIQNGAPYDVFLSADLDHPQALVSRGSAEANTLFTFAVGQLVLWTNHPDVQLGPVAATVRSKAVHRIAVANADTSPYGRAAKQALEKIGAWGEIQDKLVFGENITQTAQFVETGSADIGFVALSLVLSPKLKERGRWIPVPEDHHEPLAQGAVLTRKGAKNVMAIRYLEFLRSADARIILASYGYRAPAPSQRE